MSPLSRRTVLAMLGAAAVPPVVTVGARPAAAADDNYLSNLDMYSKTTEGVDYARRFRRHAAFDDSDAPAAATPTPRSWPCTAAASSPAPPSSAWPSPATTPPT